MRLFLSTYLFYRFPRLRQKLDVFYWFLARVPAESNPAYQDTGGSSNRHSIAEAMMSMKDFGERSAFYTRLSSSDSGDSDDLSLGESTELQKINDTETVNPTEETIGETRFQRIKCENF